MPFTPEQEAEARPVMSAARREERQGSLANALDVLARGVDRHPDNPMLLTRYGSRLRGAGRYTEAIATIRRALVASPDERFVALELGTTLRMDTRPDEALRLHEGLLRRFPDDPDVVAGWALDSALLGEPERGADRLLAVVAGARSRLDLAVALARVMVALGRHREAVRRCDEVLAREPRAFSTHAVKVLALRGLRAPIEEAVEAAWRLNERAAWALFLRGEAAEAAGDRDEAVFWHLEAVGVHARFHLASLALGRLHARMGDLDRARERLREAAALAPWDGRAKGTWLRFRMATGEPGLPLDRLEQEAARRPHCGLSLQLGRALLEIRKDPRAALPHLERAAASAPDDVRAWEHLARATEAAGRPTDAARAWAKAREIALGE